MTRDEAQNLIEGTKIEVGSRGEEVIKKLNDIYETANPLPDYPFVYIIDGKPTWGSSPRKFNASELSPLSLDSLLDIHIDTPKVEWADGTLLKGQKSFALVHKGEVVCIYNMDTSTIRIGSWFIPDSWKEEGWSTDVSSDERATFFETLFKRGYVYSEDGLRMARLIHDIYWYLRPNFKTNKFILDSDFDSMDGIDDARWEMGNYFTTKSKALEAIASMKIINSTEE